MRARFAAVLPVVVLALAGCKCTSCDTGIDDDADAQTAGFVNANCPIAGGAIDVSAGAADFGGHKVGFCCPGCEDGWNEMADSDKKDFVAKALTSNG